LSTEPSGQGVGDERAPLGESEVLAEGASATPEPEDGLDWRRVHPVTPAVRSWKAFVGIIAVLSWQTLDNVGDAREFVASGGLRWILLGVAAVVAIAAVYSALAWRFTRFAVGEEAVHLHTGVLFRQQRQARLDRLQSVDVVRPFVARLAGLSQLTLEVAGAADSNVELAYLKDEDAMRLRAELLAKAAGVRLGNAPVAAAPGVEGEAGAVPPPAPFVEEAPERTVLEVPVPRLVGSILLSSALVGFVVFFLLGLTAILVAALGGASLEELTWSNGVVLLPALLGVASFVWSRFTGGYGFRAAISPDGIRLAHGLLETRAQTIAPGRIQAIELSQPLLWRQAGWWRVRMNVAGYGTGATQESQTTLLPVGDKEQALLASWLVLPDLGTEDAVGLLTEAMEGSGAEGGFSLVSRRVRFLSPLTYRRNGFLVTERALMLRRGRLRRLVQIVPHERTQSLGLEQGPIARALRVAAFTVHSVSGPVRPVIDDLDLELAYRLLEEQSVRARQARAADRSERWMEQP